MYISLSISSQYLKALVLQGKRVKAWHKKSLPAGLVESGIIKEPEALGKEIDAFFREHKLSRDSVITAIAGLPFVYRFLTLPKMKPALLEEAIFRAMAREITLPIEDLSFSWKQVAAEGNEQQYFVMGVPHAAVDAVKKALRAAHVSRYLMGIRPLALSRAANRANAIVVNMEPDGFDIALVSNGIPVVLHSMEPGGPETTLEDTIRRLSGEMLKMEDYYQSSFSTPKQSASMTILVTGELSEEEDALSLLQAETEYPVMMLQFPVTTPDDFPPGSFGANIGLALKKTPLKPAKEDTVPFRDININVFSGRKKLLKKKQEQRIPVSIVLLLVLGALLLIPLFQATQTIRVDTENKAFTLRNIDREIAIAKLEIETENEQEATIRGISLEAEQTTTLIESLLEQRAEVTRLLDTIHKNLDGNITFNHIDVSNRGITVSGQADNETHVVPYALKLESSGDFTEVRIRHITTIPGSSSGVLFELDIK